MGSTTITEDSLYYDTLCKEYDEVPSGLYGDHYDWIIKYHNQETSSSFDDYELERDTERLEYKIQCLEKEIKDTRTELENLKNNK